MIGRCPCGNAFNMTRSVRIYCSKRCKMRYYMRSRRGGVRLKATCKHCKTPMDVPMQRFHQQYCSATCRVKAWRERVAA